MASKQHKLFYGSSPDRGLDMLLYIWPDIKDEFPDAELHVCYGWKLFDQLAKKNPERRQWRAAVKTAMQHPGVTDHGRLGKKELAKVRKSCGIWAYPTYFTEINCITALDCQSDGLVPVTMTLAALDETVGSGVKLKGDIKDPKVIKKFKDELIKMMKDEKLWKEESKKAKEWAKNYKWEKIARDWLPAFNEEISTPLVSVITPTIREGWWNIMAQNLSRQTYQNFEWIIVDDYPKNRYKIAQKYAKKYNLNIRYFRGDKGSKEYKRRIALVRANNIAIKKSKGELLVWLQDFIILPKDGIEKLADVYRHHPNDLIAPVDIYYHALPANKENKEDWWDGQTQIITGESWRNVRVKYDGIRYTDKPEEFEMDYGAIPKSVLERLNGWWEFFDDGLGYDNTEIARRALKSGSRIVVDDTNVAKCINIWSEVGGTAQNITGREKMLNTPRYQWFIKNMDNGKLPVVRDIKLDESIKLDFEVPDDISDEQAHIWINQNAERLAKEWSEK